MYRLGVIATVLLGLTACSPQSKSQPEQKMLSTLRQLDAEIDNFKFELHAGKMDSELLAEQVQSQRSELNKIESQLQSLSKESREAAKKEVSRLSKNLQNLQSEQNSTEAYLKKLQNGHQSTTQALKALESEINGLKRDVADLSSALRSISRVVGAGSSSTTYYVRAGDSLGIIAKRHNTTVEQIKRLNDLKHDTIYVGQKLRIPSSSQS